MSTETKVASGDIFESEAGETIIALRSIDYGMLWRCAVTMSLGSKVGFKDTTICPFAEDQLQRMKHVGSIRA